MPEGLSADEVGKEIAEHTKHGGNDSSNDRRERVISIVEAVLLSVVALLAAYSGYAAAKWGTESRIDIAHGSTLRSEANRANLSSMALRNFDSSTFEAWFAAYTAGNKQAMALAEHRFRPEFKVAFDAWRATNPETNPNAPRGPTYMPQYKQPGVAKAKRLDAEAEEATESGEDAGETGDKYIRVTVFLASVLFLVGISTQFPIRGVRYALVGVGAALLIISIVQLTQLQGPP
jgi:hypothetical protein